MPVNDRYPARRRARRLPRPLERKRRRVFVEYVMLAGVNDRYEQAPASADCWPAGSFKVNLIPYNPTASPYAWIRPRRDRRLPRRARASAASRSPSA